MSFPEKYHKYDNPDPSTDHYAAIVVSEIMEVINEIVDKSAKRIYKIGPDSVLGTDLRHAVIRELSLSLQHRLLEINDFEKKNTGNLLNYPWGAELSYEDRRNKVCKCGKTHCLEHCNYCGDNITYWQEPDLYLMNKYEYEDWKQGKIERPRHYPANLNHKPHLLCNFKDREDYELIRLAEERRLKLAWLPGQPNREKKKTLDQVNKENRKFFT